VVDQIYHLIVIDKYYINIIDRYYYIKSKKNEARLRTLSIGYGCDQTHSVALRHELNCTRTQLRTDPIARRPDYTPTDCARTQSDTIAIEKTEKILIDNEKT